MDIIVLTSTVARRAADMVLYLSGVFLGMVVVALVVVGPSTTCGRKRGRDSEDVSGAFQPISGVVGFR